MNWNTEYKQETPTWLNLPEGDHDFTVEDVAFGHHSGEGKIPACPMVEVTLVFKHPEGGTNKVTDRLYLCDDELPTASGKTWRPIWRVNSFFTSTGATGASYGERMSSTKGKTGRAKISHREYNGKTYDQVDRYLPKPKTPTFEPGKF